jgi:predicted secreted protein
VDNFGSVLTFTTTAAPAAAKIVIVLTVGTNIVTVDGKATSVDAAPEIVNSRTFVPIRFIAETFGSTVEWLPQSRGITITLGDTTIGLQIGKATAVINGNTIALEAAPYIKNSRTMVPLRVISESFGGDAVWDSTARTITISYMLP